MHKYRWLVAGCFLTLSGAALVAYWLDLYPLPEVEDGDYPMQPLSIFTKDGQSHFRELASGQMAWLHTGPDRSSNSWAHTDAGSPTVPYKEVKAYPELKSGRPVYGAVDFAEQRVMPGKEPPFCFVVDESQGTGKGYDRLYFDLNYDFDLTNDSPLSPLEDPPAIASSRIGSTRNVVFAPLRVPFDFGPALGRIPVEILPSLNVSDRYLSMTFIATEARKGKIQMGRHRFPVILAQWQRVTGRYDAPAAELYVMATGFGWGVLRDRWLGDDSLASLRLVDGEFYTLSTTPTGDTLRVRRYRGETGVLRIDPGRRDITDVAMSGTLSSDSTIVPVGSLPYVNGPLEKVRECEVPVGDYGPEPLRFRFGRLSFWLSDNYHKEGKRGGARGELTNPIRIRKDTPFALDFANRPEIMFLSPLRDQTFKPGDEVVVEAVLVDPVLRTMIRGIHDTTRKVSRKSGNRTVEVNLSLDPVVTISDGSGKRIAEGTMPFG